MKQKRIFITGAAGFIGFHMARHFHRQGDEVLGYDNFNAYYDPRLKHARAAELSRLGIAIVQGDLREPELLKRAVVEHQTTHILHLAAQAGVRYSLTHPHLYLQSNVEGFLNILELCREIPNIPLIYASSSSVYGDNEQIPFRVGDGTDRQTSLYGVTKKTNEMMAQVYHRLFGIAVTGLRFFTVYGPWGRPDMAYFSFTEAILRGQPITLFNRGLMERDFTYIEDIVLGTAAAVERAAPCALFNLGHHHPEGVLSLVAALEKELGRKAECLLLPMQPGEMATTYADIEESRSQLGFEPKISLEEGVADFVRWYKDCYQKLFS